MDNFVNLHNHTEFSMLDGMINMDELINFAEENNQSAIAMTDHGCMGGFYKFLKKTENRNLKPIIGIELYMVRDIDFPEHREKGDKEQKYHILALAKNRKGLENLFKLSTEGYRNFYYKPRINMEMIEKYKDNVIFSSACVAGPLSQLILNGRKDLAVKQARKFKKVFEDFYIEIMPHSFGGQRTVNPKLVEIAKEVGIPLIATADSHYLKEESESHPVLLGIGSGGDMWEFSGEETYHPMTGDQIKDYFQKFHSNIDEKTIEEAINNTVKIADKVEKIETQEKFKIIPKPFPELETKEQELEKLKELIEEGWEKKGMLNKKDKPEYQERLQHELNQIKELDFVRYFLVIYDMYENFVKSNDIMWGPGRGSSASSLVCCLLDITTPDPIKHDLLFSRFINPDRVNMPDIDTDFEDRRRDEIKGWIKEKYGEKNTADIITYGHMKGKQVLRDVGRVFDIPKKDIDKISNFIIQRDQGDARKSQTVEDSFKEFEECKKFNRKHPKVLPHVKNLEGRKRQKGTHAAGVISAPFPLTQKMSLEKQGGKDGKMVTALEGKECESLGFMKFDILGLKTLSVIKDTISQIALTQEDIENYGIEVDLDEPRTMVRKDLVNLDYNNPEVLEAFNRGDTEGVFQFNSVGMSDTLKEAPVKKFDHLVALNSLYRPGGMRSGIAHDYIDRMDGEEYESLHPIYDDITEDTYGLIIYQEQIMQVFGRMANFSAVEVHMMRKKVAKSYGVESMQELEDDFLEGCQENGIDLGMAKDLFAKMVHFGSYAFNKSHAVVYTQIAYWTQWLKVYYPLEFLVASLNNEDDDDDVKELLGELENQGYELLMPHVNKSNKHFKIEERDGEKKVRCGLKYIKGIGEKTADEIVKHQPYEDEEDIKNREGIKRRVFHKGIREKLREVGAWDDKYIDQKKKKLRKKLARKERFPFPVLDENIEKAKELANYYDADYTDIDNIDYNRNHSIVVRGVWSGKDFNRVGDFGDPSKSKYEAGARYVNMDLLDGTAHIRVKFNPKKYNKYKNTGLLEIGNKVLIKGYVIEDVKMIFVSFALELTKERVEKHKEKYGGD